MDCKYPALIVIAQARPSHSIAADEKNQYLGIRHVLRLQINVFPVDIDARESEGCPGGPLSEVARSENSPTV